jgi:hypothetical protein
MMNISVKHLITVTVFTIITLFTMSQSADQIVQQQLEAYNARNIDDFMAVFHQDIEIWTLGADSPTVVGWEKVKGIYQELFLLSPELHSKVLNRSVIGNRVIDYERISGRKGSKEDLFLVMIYEVEEGKIRRAWAVRE